MEINNRVTEYLNMYCCEPFYSCTDFEMLNRIRKIKSTDYIKIFFEIRIRSGYTALIGGRYVSHAEFIIKNIIFETISLRIINSYFDIDINFS